MTHKARTVNGRSKLDQSAFEIAGRIRARREELGLTESEVARRINQKAATYSHWEKQFGTLCQSRYLDIVSQALSISPSILTGDEPYQFDGTKIDELVDAENVILSTAPKPTANLSIAQLDLLGARAENRRKELKLIRHEIAIKLGISALRLRAWEKSIPQTITQKNLDAWELELKVPSGWLLNEAMETPAPLAPPPAVFDAGHSLTAADEIRKIGCWLARSGNKKTTDIQKLTQSEARNAEIFALRYGVSGEEKSTLQATGDSFGLTKERARQIVDKMLKGLHIGIIVTPIIDTLLSSIMPRLPMSVAELDQHFREQLGETLSIESLDRFSREILGKSGLQITGQPGGMTIPWGKAVIDPANHNETKLRAIRDCAVEMTRCCGGAQINWVAGTASWRCGELVTEQEILRTCRMIASFRWLVEEDGWFWFGENTPADNRVLRLTKKMVAVAGQRMDVEDIQQGLSRARRTHYNPDKPRPIMIEPPLAVVVAILSQVPWLKVIQKDDFLADPLIPVEDVLSDSELELYNLMQSFGGAISRYDIKQSKRFSYSDMMISMILDSSPIFSRLDTGVFVLRGRHIDIASMQRAMGSVRRGTSRATGM